MCDFLLKKLENLRAKFFSQNLKISSEIGSHNQRHLNNQFKKNNRRGMHFVFSRYFNILLFDIVLNLLNA